MAFNAFHQLLSLQTSQANANLGMFEQLQRSRQLAIPAPAPPKPLGLLLLGDLEVQQIQPALLPTNVYCRTVGSRYRHLMAALNNTPDLSRDVAQADVVVLAYGRDDLSRQVQSRRGVIPIPARMVADEAIEVVQELQLTKPQLEVYCMEALPLKHWDDERRMAAGMLLDQLCVAPTTNGVISADWCPDAFIQDSGHLTPQGYKAFAQQLHTLMWHIQDCPAW